MSAMVYIVSDLRTLCRLFETSREPISNLLSLEYQESSVMHRQILLARVGGHIEAKTYKNDSNFEIFAP